MSDPTTRLLAKLGIEAGGTGQYEFDSPSALACDSEGNLVIADTNNHRITKLSSEGKYLWSLGRHIDGHPQPGTAQGEFNSPQAVSTDVHNNVYVADTRNCRVQKLSPEGEFLTIFGSWGSQLGQFGGEGPLGIAIDENGLILVSDSHTIMGGNHRIQRFDPDGQYVDQFGSYGSGPGQFGGAMPIREYGFDFGPGIGPGSIGPTSLVVRTDMRTILEANNWGGPIYCADCDNDRIQIFLGIGVSNWKRAFGEGIVYRPRQLALDTRGRLYVSGLHKHEPPAAVESPTDRVKWRVEPEYRWVAVLDPNSGNLLGRIGTSEAHDLVKHRFGAGLHAHGYGLAINPSDDRIVYIQGDNFIFKYQVEWDQ